MRVIVLVVSVLFVLGYAGIAQLPGRNCPVGSRNQLLNCVGAMDGLDDGVITVSEIDTFMAAHTDCIPAAVRDYLTGANIVAACDTDSSGNLTIDDWDAPTGCFQLRSRQLSLCRMCDRCGLLNPIVKKRHIHSGLPVRALQGQKSVK